MVKYPGRKEVQILWVSMKNYSKYFILFQQIFITICYVSSFVLGVADTKMNKPWSLLPGGSKYI